VERRQKIGTNNRARNEEKMRNNRILPAFILSFYLPLIAVFVAHFHKFHSVWRAALCGFLAGYIQLMVVMIRSIRELEHQNGRSPQSIQEASFISLPYILYFGEVAVDLAPSFIP
jgi:xanthine/uracil permease